MGSVYTRLHTQLEQHFTVVLGIILLCTALVAHTTLRPLWDSWHSQRALRQFVSDIEQSQSISAQEYWQFRQFYSPGYFTIHESAVGHGMTYTIEEINSDKTDLLYFHSSHLTSIDSVLPQNSDTAALLEQGTLSEVRIATDTLVLSHDPVQQLYRLRFIAPIAEMRTANGFFDYTVEEQAALADQQWFNATEISY